jgi:hypothetical protein
MKKRCEDDEYSNPMEAESAFRKSVEDKCIAVALPVLAQKKEVE